jgi:hypothetical protein
MKRTTRGLYANMSGRRERKEGKRRIVGEGRGEKERKGDEKKRKGM